MDKKCFHCGRLFLMRSYWDVLGKLFCGKRCWEVYSEKAIDNKVL